MFAVISTPTEGKYNKKSQGFDFDVHRRLLDIRRRSGGRVVLAYDVPGHLVDVDPLYGNHEDSEEMFKWGKVDGRKAAHENNRAIYETSWAKVYRGILMGVITSLLPKMDGESKLELVTIDGGTVSRSESAFIHERLRDAIKDLADLRGLSYDGVGIRKMEYISDFEDMLSKESIVRRRDLPRLNRYALKDQCSHFYVLSIPEDEVQHAELKKLAERSSHVDLAYDSVGSPADTKIKAMMENAAISKHDARWAELEKDPAKYEDVVKGTTWFKMFVGRVVGIANSLQSRRNPCAALTIIGSNHLNKTLFEFLQEAKHGRPAICKYAAATKLFMPKLTIRSFDSVEDFARHVQEVDGARLRQGSCCVS